MDLLGASNLIPGPTSTELAIYLGYSRAGRIGLVLAGLLFILPAMLLVLAFAWAYVQFGSTPQAGALLYGVKPVIVAVIVQAIYGLLRSAVKSWALGVVVLIVALTSVADEQFRSRVYALGADLFWIKPGSETEIKQFQDCIASLLGSSSLPSPHRHAPAHETRRASRPHTSCTGR